MNPTLQMNATTPSERESMTPNVLTPSPALQATNAGAANPYQRAPPPSSFRAPNVSATTTIDTPMKEGGGAMYPLHESQGAAQALEYKLHATAASFRQSRDTAHRQHQMAQERLRVVQEEVQAAQRSVQSMQEHLQSLQATYSKDQKAHVDLQGEVQRLSNEVRFQHAELIGKRNQFQELQNRQASTDRIQLLEQLREKLHQRRSRHTSRVSVVRSNTALPALALVDLVQPQVERRSEETIRRWTRCVQQVTPEEDMTLGALELAKWQRRAQGYRDFLALHSPPANGDATEVAPVVETAE